MFLICYPMLKIKCYGCFGLIFYRYFVNLFVRSYFQYSYNVFNMRSVPFFEKGDILAPVDYISRKQLNYNYFNRRQNNKSLFYNHRRQLSIVNSFIKRTTKKSDLLVMLVKRDNEAILSFHKAALFNSHFEPMSNPQPYI